MLDIFRKDSKEEALKYFGELSLATDEEGNALLPHFLLKWIQEHLLIDEAIDRIGKWASIDHGLYDTVNDRGPNNSREEGHHDLMRRFQQADYLELDGVIVVLNNLFDYFYAEIQKSKFGIGLVDYFYAEIQKSKFGIGRYKIAPEFQKFYKNLDRTTMKINDIQDPMTLVDELLSVRNDRPLSSKVNDHDVSE